MNRYSRGLALPTTLFFVLVAFFAASALMVRSHQEARASTMETLSIQKEALARSALTTTLVKLNEAQTDDEFETFTLQGPDGLVAKTWIEKGDDQRIRIFAKVEGGVGQAYLAQKVVTKKPLLTAQDVAHLVDGDIHSADQVKIRPVGSESWVLRPSPSHALMWVEADRRGNLFANHFPILDGVAGDLPSEFIERLVDRNDALVRAGNIGFDFIQVASRAIEANENLNLNAADLSVGVNAGNGGLNAGNLPPGPTSTGSALAGAGQTGNLSTAGYAGSVSTTGYSEPFVGSVRNQRNPYESFLDGRSSGLETNPAFIKSAREVADAFAKGATIQHYSDEKDTWNVIPLELPEPMSGQFPGKTSSNGEKLFLPIHRPGPDQLRAYDLIEKTWSNVPSPPVLGTSSGQTNQILEVEADDNGFIYAQHSEGAELGLSVYNPDSKTWKPLPAPPAVYIKKDGSKTDLHSKVAKWDNLEVGENGEVYIIWRTKTDPKVNEHLFQTASPGGTASAGFGFGGLSGFASFPKAEAPSDILLKLQDGKWESIRLTTQNFGQLGSLSVGIDGRVVIQEVLPSTIPDNILELKSDGTQKGPEQISGIDGKLAEYFGLDSGAVPVAGKFVFRETAEY